MIFSSSLGSVEKYATDVAIKNIANHLRKLQDELEYRLSNLDSSNINEIDTDETVLRGGAVTLISQYGDDIAELKLSDQQLTATVKAQSGDISTLKQTATSLTATVQTLGGDVSTLQQTANSITATVEAQGKSISTLQQTSNSLSATVTNLGNSMSQTLRLSADGLTITNASGSALTIDGGQINAKTINTEDLNLTGKITFADLDAAAQQTISSYNPQAYLETIGITEITSEGVKAPHIVGGEIYGGIFGDLDADNYLLMETYEQQDLHYINHSMSHYIGGVGESGVPVTSIGWAVALAGGSMESMWYLNILGSPVLERRYNTLWGYHMKPKGVWDFSGCTVNFTGATVIGLNPIV